MQCFSRENNLVDYKEVCLKVNGKQSGKLRNGLIKFNKYSMQLAVLFKIYANFESVLKGVWIGVAKRIFFAALVIKMSVLMIDLANQLFLTEEKMQSLNLLQHFLKIIGIAKGW